MERPDEDRLAELLADIIVLLLAHEVYDALRDNTLIAIPKAGGDVRPIGMDLLFENYQKHTNTSRVLRILSIALTFVIFNMGSILKVRKRLFMLFATPWKNIPNMTFS
jgi:hypothetical protein